MVSSGDLRAPQFNGENYEYWSVKMKTILIAYDLWDVVECGDTSTKVSNENDSGEASGSKDKKTESVVTAAETKEKMIKDAKALCIIQGALTDDIFPRIRNEETARGAWDLLRREFRGDDKVREVKLQAVRAEFEYMRMAEGESLDHYLTKFFGVINDMKSLGEEITEARIVQKTLMSLSRKYKSIVSIIEETRDLKTLRSEEVIASLKVYDRREDMHEEREREMHIERAFSTLKVGSNQFHGGNKGSHLKSRQGWQEQQRRPANLSSNSYNSYGSTENCKPINLGEETTKESHKIYDLKAEKSHEDKMENEIQNEEVSNESREYLHSAAAENETIKESFLDEAGSKMHLENQICGTASGNDGRTETANVKEVELEVDEHPSETKTTKNTCSQKEETKEQEECGSGVECNIDMQKNDSNEFNKESTLLLCDKMSAISMARNPD